MLSALALSANGALTVESVYPALGRTNVPLSASVSGSDFHVDTRALLFVDSDNARLVRSSVSGTGHNVRVDVDVMYSVLNEELRVTDIRTLSSPQQLAVMGGFMKASGLEVAEGKVYVADDRGLTIIDVSDPSSPAELGRATTPGFADASSAPKREVVVSGGHAYMTDADAGLQIIHIADPQNPVLVGSFDSGDTHDVDVQGNVVYLASTNGLYVVDVSTPSAPSLLSHVASAGRGYGASVRGTHLYFARLQHQNLQGAIWVFDVTNPADPQVVDVAIVVDAANGIDVAGDRAYVPVGLAGLQVFDLTDPDRPASLGVVNSPFNAVSVDVAGDLAFIGDTFSVEIVDVTAPEPPPVLSGFGSDLQANDIALVGNLAYVIDAGGFTITDISAPGMPVVLGRHTGVTGEWLAVGSGVVYASHRNSGIYVVDVLDPGVPKLVTTIPASDARHLRVVGDQLYVTSTTGLRIFDISTPTEPGEVSFVPLASALDVDVRGNLAYVARGDAGLAVVDVTDPAAPVLLETQSTMDTAFNVTIVGEKLYVTEYNFVQIYDVGETSPTSLAAVRVLPGRLSGRVTVIGDIVYVANGNLRALDVSEPVAPIELATVATPGLAYAFQVRDGFALVADGSAGVSVTALPVELNATPEDDVTLQLGIPPQALAGNYSLRVFNRTEAVFLYGGISIADGPVVFSNTGGGAPAATAVSKAIIVAGGGPYAGNNLWEATRDVANYAYRALTYQGYDRENIYYLNPDMSIDVDGDGLLNDVDAVANIENLQAAIVQWAAEGDGYELLLYLVDHGGDGRFRLNQTTEVSALELAGWLDDLQARIPGKIVVIYDACLSGSFVDPLRSPDGRERVVVTSSAADENAFFVNRGALSFSFQFWASVFSGGDVRDSFHFARDMMRDFQTSQVDANGNGIANEKSDRNALRGLRIGRGYIPASDKPTITFVSAPQTLGSSDSEATIVASGIIDVTGVERVWGVIRRPDFVGEVLGTPVLDMPELELTDEDGDNTWTGTYTQFDVAGTYEITLYAQNPGGFFSSPSATFNNKTTVTRLGVGVGDQVPIIALLGDPDIRIAQDVPFADPGALAVDHEDGDLSGSVVADGVVDTSVPGESVIVYRVTDSFGNEASATREITVSPRDRDNDRLPDDFESLHGFDPLDPSDAVLDSDGDTLSNLDEFLAGSDPRDANDPVVFTDHDGDGIANDVDTDDDNDGVLDQDDAFPFDETETADQDGDGTGDNADPDADNDGIVDENDAFPLDPSENADADGDGIGDVVDIDDDNDGVADADDHFPLLAGESSDSDGDGVGDVADLDDDNDGVPDTVDAFPTDPTETVDTDRDGTGNNADDDDDEDGVLDIDDALPTNAAESRDFDGDGLGDNLDADDDGDGVDDLADDFPFDASETIDLDRDGLGGNADDDDDGDGVADSADAFPDDPTETMDTDGDGIGDGEDADDDNDGVPDTLDDAPTDSTVAKIARLGNISTRGVVGEGDDVLIGGVIIEGDTPQKVTIRARGPSLAAFGVAGVLLDPRLELFNAQGELIDSGDDWAAHRSVNEMPLVLTPEDPREAAITITLDPGAYTAIVRGSNGEVGVGIVEVFTVDP